MKRYDFVVRFDDTRISAERLERIIRMGVRGDVAVLRLDAPEEALTRTLVAAMRQAEAAQEIGDRDDEAHARWIEATNETEVAVRSALAIIDEAKDGGANG